MRQASNNSSPDVHLSPLAAELATQARHRRIAVVVYRSLRVIFLSILGGYALIIAPMKYFLSSLFGSSSGGGHPGAWLYPLLFYAALFVLPILYSLPLLLLVALRWHNPARIIVFRRFNLAFENSVVRRVLAQHLAPMGHVFTLADSKIHTPWSVRVPLILGQLGFVHFRPRKIVDAEGLKKLRNRLKQIWFLNINWMVSYQKIFPIKSDDGHWQDCVNLLLEEANLVVVDVSNPKETLHWEISQCVQAHLEEKLIFLLDNAKAESGRAWIAECARALPSIQSVPIFLYAVTGPQDPAALRSFVLETLSRSVVREPAASLRQVVFGLGLNVAASLLIATVGTVAMAPYQFPEGTILHSPSYWQIRQAYVYGEPSGEASDRALARLQQEASDASMRAFINYLQSPFAYTRTRAIIALSKIGDENALEPIISSVSAPDRKDQVELVHAYLAPFLKRHLNTISPALVQAMCRSPGLYFDEEIFQLVDASLRALNSGSLSCLLDSSGESARFTGALIIDPNANPRTIPVLLEMINWGGPGSRFSWTQITIQLDSRPLSSLAATELDKISDSTLNNMDLHLLDPFMLGDNSAADSAVTLALRSSNSTYVRSLVIEAQPGSGPALLKNLVAFSRIDNLYKPRAVALLNTAKTEWLTSFLPSQNKNAVVSAAYALALRGNASGLSPSLSLLNVGESCYWVLVCHPYQDLAIGTMEKLTISLPPSTRLAINIPQFHSYPDNAIVALTDLVVRFGDDSAFRGLMREVSKLPAPSEWLISDVANRIPLRLLPRLEELTQEERPSAKSSLVEIVQQVRAKSATRTP